MYNRFGGRKLTSAQRRYAGRAWAAFSYAFPRKSRFTVLEGFTLPPTAYARVVEACAVFRDIRYEGARRQDRGVYLVCGNRDMSGFGLFEQVQEPEEGRGGHYKVLKK